MSDNENKKSPQKNKPTGVYTFAARLRSLLSKNCGTAAKKSKVVSEKTSTDRSKTIELCFRELTEAGYKFQDPKSFANRHMTFLAEKWETNGLSPSTIQNRISIMRVFCTWIGKDGMIGAPENYVKSPNAVARTYIAQRDKTWVANGVDPKAIIDQIASEDPYAANQIKAVLAFGLRRKEAVCLHPHIADRGLFLSVNDGTKGGRARTVAIDSDFKRQVIDELKKAVSNPSGHLGKPHASLKSNLSRLDYMMKKHGITGRDSGVTLHGLRHQYLNERYEALSGTPSPIRGGSINDENLEDVKKAMMLCAEEAGHARISITSAYFGKLHKEPKAKNAPEQGVKPLSSSGESDADTNPS